MTPVASITGPVTGCPAARAAPGSCSHINAGRIDCVIEVRVRSFVLHEVVQLVPEPAGFRAGLEHLPDLVVMRLRVADPGVHVTHRRPTQRRRMHQHGEGVAGLPGPVLPIALRRPALATRRGPGDQIPGPVHRGLRIRAAGQRVESHVGGDAADARRVEHEHRPPHRAQPVRLLIQIRAGAGGDHRARRVDDPTDLLDRLTVPRTTQRQLHVLADAHTHNQPTLHNRYANSDVGTRNRCHQDNSR